MALQHDLLKRIINVHWASGGGDFVAGNFTPCIYRRKNDEWEKLGHSVFTEYGVIYGSAYAQEISTFILVGSKRETLNPENPDEDLSGIIAVSKDGKEWMEAYEYINSGWAGNKNGIVIGAVWDANEQCFYAGGGGFKGNSGGDSPHPEAGSQYFEDVLWKSSNGLTWTEVARREVGYRFDEMDGDGPKNYEGLLIARCRNKVQDSRGHNVPDGNYGYRETDAANSVLIAPQKPLRIEYGTARMYQPGGAGGGVVVTKKKDGNTTTTTVDVGFRVNAVAYAGGVWIAFGGDAGEPIEGENPGCFGNPRSAMSTDDGASWETSSDEALPSEGDQFQIVTAVAAAQRE